MSPERRSSELSNRGSRRGKRFFRLGFPTLRLFFILAGLFIVFYTAFGPEMPFHDRLEDRESSRREHQVVEDRDLVQHEAEQRISRPLLPPPPPPPPPLPIPRTKPRRSHLPCEIGFEKSVTYFVEPMDLGNFTNFSLEYVDIEEATGSLKPRFGGHQTLNDREKSFIAQNQTIHCGFVEETVGNPSIGFDLEEKDMVYMKTCKIVVSSCIFGNSDFLRRPAKKQISDYSKRHVCFVMFLDEQTISKLSSEGSIPDREGKIGLWKIVVVKNLPYSDMRRTGKVPKLLSHRLFPAARYSIWIDSKMRLNTDPMLILEYFLWRTKSEYAISNHYDRHCVWDEVLQNKRLNKYDHKAIDRQFIFYQSDGLTKFDPSRPNNLLPSYVPEGSFIVRAHTPMSNLFSCLWFNEVDRFTSRDQLSFAYTYLKLRRMNPDKSFYLNMFKDCERRSLAKLFQHRVLPPPPTAP